MRQNRSFVRSGYIGHATIGFIHRLQREPEADFLIVEDGSWKASSWCQGVGSPTERWFHEREIRLEANRAA